MVEHIVLLITLKSIGVNIVSFHSESKFSEIIEKLDSKNLAKSLKHLC